MKALQIVFILLMVQFSTTAQQIADSAYDPLIKHPEYPVGKGPVVFIDEGHHNFHTKDGRFMPFAKLLEKDGYNVQAYTGTFKKTDLSKGKILVIANALNEVNTRGWYLPTPSAFTADEISAVKDWVSGGGSLFLIADHMPFAGAAGDLAAAFGFRFSNGFAIDTLTQGPSYFSVKEGTLTDNVITRGKDISEAVRQVVTFAGQGFTIPSDATPILLFDPNWMSFEPDTAWVFTRNTRTIPITGWSQGAYATFGKGNIVVFGEAAMFTAQLAGPNRTRVGMNAEYAGENYRLLLNILHWLDGR